MSSGASCNSDDRARSAARSERRSSPLPSGLSCAVLVARRTSPGRSSMRRSAGARPTGRGPGAVSERSRAIDDPAGLVHCQTAQAVQLGKRRHFVTSACHAHLARRVSARHADLNTCHLSHRVCCSGLAPSLRERGRCPGATAVEKARPIGVRSQKGRDSRKIKSKLSEWSQRPWSGDRGVMATSLRPVVGRHWGNLS